MSNGSNMTDRVKELAARELRKERAAREAAPETPLPDIEERLPAPTPERAYLRLAVEFRVRDEHDAAHAMPAVFLRAADGGAWAQYIGCIRPLGGGAWRWVERDPTAGWPDPISDEIARAINAMLQADPAQTAPATT
jgi:hypothetical protein